MTYLLNHFDIMWKYHICLYKGIHGSHVKGGYGLGTEEEVSYNLDSSTGYTVAPIPILVHKHSL